MLYLKTFLYIFHAAYIYNCLVLDSRAQILKRLPWRYAAVMVVSCAQLYGDVLYFMTEHYEDYAHVDWSHWLYYFVYFSMFNIVWLVIPTTLIVWAWINTSQAVSQRDRLKAH